MNNNPTSLYTFFTSPDFVNSASKYNCIQTSILRYYLTAVTGKRLKNERLSKEVIEKQIQKLKKIEVNSDFDINYHLNLIEKGGKMYGKTPFQMKTHISYGRRFFKFVKKLVYPSTNLEKQDKKLIPCPYREIVIDKSDLIAPSHKTNKKIILQKNPKEYLIEIKNKYPNLSEGKIHKKIQNSLKEIFSTIDSFREYKIKIEKRNREIVIESNIKRFLRFLGWYKKYKKLTIDNLKINNIIPIINPYIEFLENNDGSFENIQKISLEEWYLKRKIKAEVKTFLVIVDEFLINYLFNATESTKKMYIESLIIFAKYLYRNITDKEENDDYQDIYLINILKVRLRNINKIKKSKQEKIIPFTWEEILIVFRRLKEEADRDYQYKKGKKDNKGNRLTKRAKALHLQDFLAVAFFCIMPPDRQRTFRELEFGGTLKYGIRDKIHNTFTSHEKLKEKETPKYYIHLLPHQYKTGDTYGVYWHEIDNFDFGDNTKFYDYLDKWLFKGYRDELATAGKTNFVFIRYRKGSPFASKDLKAASIFSEYIKNIFNRKTKFPLNPHALRDIYVTHINNLNLSEETRRAIAYMMHHDLETANTTYNKQTMDEKIALGVDFVNSANLVSTTDTSGLTAITS